jgi:hypothetical protein
LGNKTAAKPPKNNNLEKKENLDLDEKTCIYCEKTPERAYKCECGTYACELCYLRQFDFHDSVKCLVCGKSENYTCQEETSPSSEVHESDSNNDDNEQRSSSNDNEEKDDFDEMRVNFDSIINILPNNLNMESKNSINDFVDTFRKEMLEVVGEKFENFIQNEVKKIYYDILEKYNENITNKGMNMKGAMKSKRELTTVAANEIKNQLQKPAVENFLKTVSSNLFQDIIKIFESEMLNKVKEFINNTEEINKYFQSNDMIPDESQNLKIEGQFQNYIKNLRQRETESQEKALRYQENISDENQGCSSIVCDSDKPSSYSTNE